MDNNSENDRLIPWPNSDSPGKHLINFYFCAFWAWGWGCPAYPTVCGRSDWCYFCRTPSLISHPPRSVRGIPAIRKSGTKEGEKRAKKEGEMKDEWKWERRGGRAKMTFGGKKIVPDWGKYIVELQGCLRVQKDLPGNKLGGSGASSPVARRPSNLAFCCSLFPYAKKVSRDDKPRGPD